METRLPKDKRSDQCMAWLVAFSIGSEQFVLLPYVASQVQDLHDLERLESKCKFKRTPLEIVDDLNLGDTVPIIISLLSIELICFPASYRCNKYKHNILNITECTQYVFIGKVWTTIWHRAMFFLMFAVQHQHCKHHSVATKVNRQRPASWLRRWPCDLDSVPMRRPRGCRGTD